MTDPETISPPPEPLVPATIAAPPPPPPPPAPKPQKSGGGFWRLLGVLGFLLLAAGEFYLWRLDHLAQPPSVAALFGTTPAPSPAQNFAQPVETGIASQVATLQSQLTALQDQFAKSQPAPDAISVQTDLTEKTAELGAQIAALQTEFATDHAAVTTLAASGANLQKTAEKIELLGAVAGARMALDSGQPVGTIQGAPPALAAFATTPPPTMAELILTYPQAEDAANAASAEKAAKSNFWHRVLARLSGLVTISNGDHVILGAPAAAITAQAGEQLDAGDLAGAVATLTSNLSPYTLNALGPWLQKAKSLLAARAAIAQMSQS
jgi:hypothetical protein